MPLLSPTQYQHAITGTCTIGVAAASVADLCIDADYPAGCDLSSMNLETPMITQYQPQDVLCLHGSSDSGEYRQSDPYTAPVVKQEPPCAARALRALRRLQTNVCCRAGLQLPGSDARVPNQVQKRLVTSRDWC